jgi:hypothetical protein
MNGKNMYALNAITLKTLYAASQAADARDSVSGVASFCDTPAAAAGYTAADAADGIVFLGAQANLVTYGLFGASKF